MTKNNPVDEDIHITFQFYVFLTKHASTVPVNKSQAKCDFNVRTLSRRAVINLCCSDQLSEYLLLLVNFFFFALLMLSPRKLQ